MGGICKRLCDDEAPISPHNTKKFDSRCTTCWICYNDKDNTNRCYCCKSKLRKIQLVHKEGREKRLKNIKRY